MASSRRWKREFVIEIGDERFTLHPGDSEFAPRRIPHVWAYVGSSPGKLLIAFTPAGKMEAFFNETTKANAMPAQDPGLWRTHGMELMGPPLAVDCARLRIIRAQVMGEAGCQIA